MACIICQLLRRSIGLHRAGRDASSEPASCAVIYERLQSWWSHGFNDREIFERDRDPDGIDRAHTLYEADPIAGLAAFVALADGGSVWAMVQVARIYGGGHGVPEDQPQAEIWYRRAYEGDSDEAMLWLASSALRHGQVEEAEALIARGVEKGLTPALRLLARRLLARTTLRSGLGRHEKRQARRQARALLERASTLGDLGARHDLAGGMAWGRFGVRQMVRGRRALAAVILELSDDPSADAAAVPTETLSMSNLSGPIGLREAFG